MAAPVLAGEGAATSPTATTIRIVVPSGTVAGDQLLAHVLVLHPTDASITAPVGWALLDEQTFTVGANQAREALYTREANGSEGANYTWGIVSGAVGFAGAMVRITGAQAAPLVGKLLTTTGNNIVFPSVTTPSADNLILLFGYAPASTTGAGTFAMTAPSGATALTTNGTRVGGAYVSQAVAGASGTKSAPLGASNTGTQPASAFTVAYAPPSGGGGAIVTTDWRFPTSGTNFNNGGSAWNLPGRITAQDNVETIAGVSALPTQALRGTGFGFLASDYPAGSTLVGIEVEIMQRAGAGVSAVDAFVYLLNGTTRVGNNKADSVNPWPTVRTYKSYGGASDLWSSGLVMSDIANIGVDMEAFKGPGTAGNVAVDAYRMRLTYQEPGGAGITASASITEANDAAVSSGALAIMASAAITEANDTAASVGRLAIAAQAALTEGDDTVTATGTLQDIIRANADIVEDSDAASSTATLLVRASATILEASDAVASTGRLSISAQASINEVSDVASSTGVLWIAASASINEADDTLSASGESIANLIAGSADIVEADDTSQSTGLLYIYASFNVTEDADSVFSEGSRPNYGAASIAEGDDVVFSTAVGFIPSDWTPVPPRGETWTPVEKTPDTWTPITRSPTIWI